LPTDYEYRGLMAEAWDILRGEKVNRADGAYFHSLITRFGEPALDAGCGTGRLLLDYLAAGRDIDGVDLSPDMLALCRRNADARNLTPRLYGQALETLHLPRRYRTILASSGLLQLITDPTAIAQAMARLHAHLLPGGALVGVFMQLWREGDPLEWTWEENATRADGVGFRRIAQARFNPATGCEDTQNVYQQWIDGKVVAEEAHVRAQATRSYTQSTARALFARAGFTTIECYSGFTTSPATPAEELFTVVGIKSSSPR
jgi:SAM-dependent methyltransferase